MVSDVTMRPLRLAIIGTGSRGLTYGREAVRPRRRRWSRRWPSRGRTGGRRPRPSSGSPRPGRSADWPDLAARADLDVDAVVVATPDRQHTAPALAFLARGLPLLLEKPMAPNEDEARQIVAAAERAGVVVCVAHVLRYSAYTTTIKAALAAGADRRRGRRRAPGAGRLVALRALLRPRQLAAGGRVQPDADGQVLPRRRLAVLRRRPARRPGVVVRQPHPLHGGEQAGRGRVALPGLRRRAGLPVLGPAGSTSTTSTSRPPSGGRCPSWPST